MSHSIYIHQSVPSSFSHPFLPSPSLHWHSTTDHQSHPLQWIYSTSWNPSQSLLVGCSAMLLLSTVNKYYIHISWFINLLEPKKIHNFLCRWCQEFKYICSGFLCGVCDLINICSWLFLWFLICGLVPVLFWSLVVNF